MSLATALALGWLVHAPSRPIEATAADGEGRPAEAHHRSERLTAPCQTPDMRRIGPALGGALVLVVAMSVGRFAYTPVLPYMRDVDGLSTAAAGWVASANYLGYLLGAAHGSSARRAPRPAVARCASVSRLSVLTTLGMAATSDALRWAALRLVGGAASAWAMIAVAAHRARPRPAPTGAASPT